MAVKGLISNLRIVSQQQNSWNSNPQKNNSSGVTGVYFDKKNKKWRANIKHNGVKRNLGSFSLKKEAIEARRQAELEIMGIYSPLYKHKHGKIK